MSEWWTYTPSDFLMFAPATWYRLIARVNATWWPSQLATLAAGLAVVLLAARAPSRAAPYAAGVLAGAFAFSAIAFHLEYASINWAASGFAIAFVAQALLLVAMLLRGRWTFAGATPRRRATGLAVAFAAIAGYPWIALALGRPLAQAETFGLMPDPAAIALLGLLCASARTPWFAWPVPLAWCAISGAFLATMGAPDATIAPLLAAAAWIVAIVDRAR